MSNTTTTRRQWSPETVLAEIRRLSVNGVAPPTGEHERLRKAASYYFGSWAKACAAAGVRAAGSGPAAPLTVPPEVQRRRMEYLRRHPHLRERLWLYALAVERGYIRAGGDGGVNPFAILNGGARPLRGAARPAS